jgi:16S rRNA (uracil1498-N3)-methyltransferase
LAKLFSLFFMQRFYLPQENFSSQRIISEDKKLIIQLAKVLRAKHGDRFLLFYGDGREFLAQLISLTTKKAEFLIVDEVLGRKELDREIVLYQSLLKADKLDWVIQKAVELGVSRIVPVISEYCITRSISAGKKTRYEQIIKEATEQCGGSRLAIFSNPISYLQAVATLGSEPAHNLIAWEKSDTEQPEVKEKKNINLFIGPEGGYSEAEIASAEENGLVVFSLGKRILRAETAAIVALARLVV